jgi:hypothetical protein
MGVIMTVDRGYVEIITKSAIKVIHGCAHALHCRSNYLNFLLALFA